MIEGKDQQEIQGWARGDRRQRQAASRMSRPSRPERQRQQGRDAAQLARRGAAVGRRRGPGLRRRRRPGHHRPSARRRAAHHRQRRPGDRRVSRAAARATIEFNIEGDPRPDLLALVREVRPHQCTLVPVHPGEVTSQAGWPADTPAAELGARGHGSAGPAASASACSSSRRRRR